MSRITRSEETRVFVKSLQRMDRAYAFYETESIAFLTLCLRYRGNEPLARYLEWGFSPDSGIQQSQDWIKMKQKFG
jgi:hypothetical protein